jgi:hypothetical protein
MWHTQRAAPVAAAVCLAVIAAGTAAAIHSSAAAPSLAPAAMQCQPDSLDSLLLLLLPVPGRL